MSPKRKSEISNKFVPVSKVQKLETSSKPIPVSKIQNLDTSTKCVPASKIQNLETSSKSVTVFQIQKLEPVRMNKKFISRFPSLAESIFDSLDNESLLKCRKINKDWDNFLTNSKLLHMRKIRKSVESRHIFGKQWRSLSKKVDTKTISEFVVTISEFYEDDLNFDHFGSRIGAEKELYSPLHIGKLHA